MTLLENALLENVFENINLLTTQRKFRILSAILPSLHISHVVFFFDKIALELRERFSPKTFSPNQNAPKLGRRPDFFNRSLPAYWAYFYL